MSFPVTECVFPVTWSEDLYCYHLLTFYFAPLVLCIVYIFIVKIDSTLIWYQYASEY